MHRVRANNKTQEYGKLLSQFEKLYKDIAPYALARDYYQEIALRNNEMLSIGFRLYQLENVLRRNGEQSFNDRKDNLLNQLEKIGRASCRERLYLGVVELCLQDTTSEARRNPSRAQ